MKRIFLSAGNKGGVGKTTCATAAVDYFLDQGHRLAIVETDLNQPDLRNRYERSDLIIGELDLAGDAEGAVVRLGTWIESKSNQVDAVVVNAPAGGGAVLDPFATILSEVAAALDFNMAIAWVIGATIEDSQSVRRSLEGGLLSLSTATRTVCLAGWMGPPAGWPWARSPVRDKAHEAGVREQVIPALTQHVSGQVIERHNAPLADLCLPSGGMSIAARSSLLAWRRRMHGLIEIILDPEKNNVG